jgi:hypothetical protein
MKVFALALVLSRLLMTGTGANAPVAKSTTVKVHLDNAVASCLDVVLGATSRQQNLLLTHATVSLLKPTAKCGCKSAVVSARVSSAKEARRDIITAELSSLQFRREPSDFVFVLGLDTPGSLDRSLVLHLGCAPPE